MPKQFKKSELKKEIQKQYGTVTNLKKHLKKIAKYQYGCYYAKVEIYGCEIVYTSNENCFAKFLITIPMIGMTSSKGLGKSSITKEGKKRGCGTHYINV